MKSRNFLGKGFEKRCFNDNLDEFRFSLLPGRMTPHRSERELIAACAPGKLKATENPDKLKCLEYLLLIRTSSVSGVRANPPTIQELSLKK